MIEVTLSLCECFARVAGSRKFEHAGWQAANPTDSRTRDSKPKTEIERESRGRGLLDRLLGGGGAQQGGDPNKVCLTYRSSFFFVLMNLSCILRLDFLFWQQQTERHLGVHREYHGVFKLHQREPRQLSAIPR